jgi:hypothetical protein
MKREMLLIVFLADRERKFMHLHLIKEMIKDIISVVTGNPQGGLIDGFPLMFHMPSPSLERPIPPRIFLACIPIIPAVALAGKGVDKLIEKWKYRNVQGEREGAK